MAVNHAIPGISVWGNHSWEKWYQDKKFWFSGLFPRAHFVQQCRGPKVIHLTFRMRFDKVYWITACSQLWQAEMAFIQTQCNLKREYGENVVPPHCRLNVLQKTTPPHAAFFLLSIFSVIFTNMYSYSLHNILFLAIIVHFTVRRRKKQEKCTFLQNSMYLRPLSFDTRVQNVSVVLGWARTISNDDVKNYLRRIGILGLNGVCHVSEQRDVLKRHSLTFLCLFCHVSCA